MEYLDGSALAGIVEQARRSGMPLPLGGLARLVAEVLDALGAAHAKGIIHRDLKPDNIYVTPAGRAKVLDFGIAKLQPELGGSATHTGSLLGTPHYMSPEQAAGRPVDARADIYAIGVILFECATLQKPFVADSLFDLLRKHVEAPPPSARALRGDMPEPLEHIIYTALAKLPDHRFASAQAMSMALQHATMNLAGEQWAPIVPASSSRSPASAWSPTPPASWAGGKRVSSIASGPTQTAGQVTGGTPKPSSKKGLWMALGALLLVGGGIAVGVVASGGKDDKQVVAAGSGSAGSAVTVGSATEPTGSGDPWRTGSTEIPPPVGPELPQPPPGEHDHDGEADEEEALSADATAILDARVGEMIEALGPDAREMFGPELDVALKKYGKWSKIPKAQRQKILAQLTGVPAAAALHAGRDVNRILAGEDPIGTPPRAPARDKKPAEKQAGLDGDGWVKSREFKLPGGHDPTKLSVEKYLPIMVAEAKRIVPDAVLYRIDVDGVYPDGRVDITAKEGGGGSMDFRFVSPARAKKPDPTPDAADDRKCEFRIELKRDHVWATPLTSFTCKEHQIGAPKCTTAQVWQKAKEAGAPTDEPANLGYRAASGGKPKWYFDIGKPKKYSKMFDDDCR
jgi:hypothetical protein